MSKKGPFEGILEAFCIFLYEMSQGPCDSSPPLEAVSCAFDTIFTRVSLKDCRAIGFIFTRVSDTTCYL
jgi:hypothetical protein